MEIVFPEIIDPVPGGIGFWDQALWDLDPAECIERERIERFIQATINFPIPGL